jgi:hypothetical protein
MTNKETVNKYLVQHMNRGGLSYETAVFMLVSERNLKSKEYEALIELEDEEWFDIRDYLKEKRK